ncbi:MAG: cobalt ECF transporter T component CbiQ [Chloroflexi bacterium]|nr:cobalt ECF transporter T component CbiQ [Chloroflexota bacterium]
MNPPSFSSRLKSRRGFIERTLTDINDVLEQSIFAEKIARQKGLLQALDPRLKVASLVLLLLAVSLSHRLTVIAALYFCALLLAALSAVPLAFFIRRVWVFVLLFTGLVALPALFITPGPTLAHLPLGLVITRTGARTALFLLLRVGASVSFAVLFILTTPWNSVMKALGVLRVPDVLVLVLGMTYRYIHLLLHTANDMFLSRQSRILRPMSGAEERHLMAATSGTLLGKSLQLSSEVYLAMESRGFRGYPRTMDRFQMRWFDWAASVVVVLISGLAIWAGR